MAGKSAKKTYDPLIMLSPVGLLPELESLARELYELACKGSKDIWPEMEGESFKDNDNLKARFLTAAHKGMNAAQQKIVEIIRSDVELTDSHHLLFRGIADAMGWQIIRQQLCHARTYYKEHRPINLKESNFDSVVYCVEEFTKQKPGSFSLISDLTSFIQVGDLLTVDSDGKLTLSEVKEGKKNHAIFKFMNFFIETQCDHAFDHFSNQYGKNGVKQLQRMFRQTVRMSHVKNVMNEGKSTDPDTDRHIRIPDELVYVPSWNEELNSTLKECDKKGWGWNVIDECLFIGIYSKEIYHGHGHAIFNSVFDNFEWSEGSPRFRLFDSMIAPLALTIFNLNIHEEHKFDILFGRKNVCLGLNIGRFLDEIRKSGLTVRRATNKEASNLDKKRMPPYRWNGKAIFIGNSKREVCLSDGIFMRIFFHGQRPVKLVHALLNNPAFEEEGQR